MADGWHSGRSNNLHTNRTPDISQIISDVLQEDPAAHEELHNKYK
jgi:hypothetical protein